MRVYRIRSDGLGVHAATHVTHDAWQPRNIGAKHHSNNKRTTKNKTKNNPHIHQVTCNAQSDCCEMLPNVPQTLVFRDARRSASDVRAPGIIHVRVSYVRVRRSEWEWVTIEFSLGTMFFAVAWCDNARDNAAAAVRALVGPILIGLECARGSSGPDQRHSLRVWTGFLWLGGARRYKIYIHIYIIVVQRRIYSDARI